MKKIKSSWNKGIPHTEEHKRNLKKAKEKEIERPWSKNGNLVPCSKCRVKIYKNKSQIKRWKEKIQKPYCENCSPKKKRIGVDQDYLNSFIKDKMTLNEIHKKYHIRQDYIRRLLLKNGLGDKIRERQKEILSELRKIDFKKGKFIFPIKDTKPEIKLQNLLKQLKIEFFTHQYTHIEHGYQCDILIPIQEGIDKPTIIECFGDYWHKFPIGREIDILRCGELRTKDYRVFVFWEREIKVMELNDLRDKLIPISYPTF